MKLSGLTRPGRAWDNQRPLRSWKRVAGAKAVALFAMVSLSCAGAAGREAKGATGEVQTVCPEGTGERGTKASALLEGERDVSGGQLSAWGQSVWAEGHGWERVGVDVVGVF
jgi:hypothetical protein